MNFGLLAVLVVLCCGVAMAQDYDEKKAICDLDSRFLHVCSGGSGCNDPCPNCQSPIECASDWHLRQLDLSFRSLMSIPESFCGLTYLDTLRLVNCSLGGLPFAIGKLSRLVTLDVSKNSIQILPTSFSSGLTSLKMLNMDSNMLKTLDEQRFAYLNTLESISFLNNQLLALPDNIGKLTNLKNANFGKNQLRTLPTSFAELTSLQFLALNNNQLRIFNPNFGNLVGLKELNLENNNINVLPDNIGNIKGLTKLLLANNMLKTLPDSVSQLTSVTTVSLSGNCFNCGAMSANTKIPYNIRSKCYSSEQKSC